MEYSDAKQIGDTEKFTWRGKIIRFNPIFLADSEIDYSIPFLFNSMMMRPIETDEIGFIVCRVLKKS